MTEEKISLHIDEGEVFYAHEVSINFNPTQFVFDFKSITPRIDPRSHPKTSIVIKHQVILVDPYHAKRILELLSNVIKKYEAEFGKITKPKELQLFEKKHRKEINKIKKEQNKIPSYFG